MKISHAGNMKIPNTQHLQAMPCVWRPERLPGDGSSPSCRRAAALLLVLRDYHRPQCLPSVPEALAARRLRQEVARKLVYKKILLPRILFFSCVLPFLFFLFENYKFKLRELVFVLGNQTTKVLHYSLTWAQVRAAGTWLAMDHPGLHLGCERTRALVTKDNLLVAFAEKKPLQSSKQ